MARFDNAIALAVRLIEKNGQTVNWIAKPVAAPTDPNKPWQGGTQAKPEHSVVICFVPVEDRRDRNFLDMFAETNIQIGALAGLMAPVNFEPSNQDVVIRGGKELRIKNANKVAPNEQTVLWIIEFLQ